MVSGLRLNKCVKVSMERKFEQKRKCENPFEDELIAKEWINSVENEKGMGRDKEIYPRLEKWLNQQNIESVIEVGSGQGICSDKLKNFKGQYIGVEPSQILTQRAVELYANDHRQFVVGDAYDLPIGSGKAEAGFSIMVWFHLEDLNKASSELSRVLKNNGKFFIVTANPNAEKMWESFYFDYKKEGKQITGKVNVPINPISKSIYYQHTQEEILTALKNNGLDVDQINEFEVVNGEKIFCSFEGKKIE